MGIRLTEDLYLHGCSVQVGSGFKSGAALMMLMNGNNIVIVISGVSLHRDKGNNEKVGNLVP